MVKGDHVDIHFLLNISSYLKRLMIITKEKYLLNFQRGGIISLFHNAALISLLSAARMVKLVNTVDLKSAARKGFPVQFRVRAPSLYLPYNSARSR